MSITITSPTALKNWANDNDLVSAANVLEWTKAKDKHIRVSFYLRSQHHHITITDHNITQKNMYQLAQEKLTTLFKRLKPSTNCTHKRTRYVNGYCRRVCVDCKQLITLNKWLHPIIMKQSPIEREIVTHCKRKN